MAESDSGPLVTHRCGRSGEAYEVRARYDPDAGWYISDCPECEYGCRRYHEPEEVRR